MGIKAPQENVDINAEEKKYKIPDTDEQKQKVIVALENRNEEFAIINEIVVLQLQIICLR